MGYKRTFNDSIHTTPPIKRSRCTPPRSPTHSALTTSINHHPASLDSPPSHYQLQLQHQLQQPPPSTPPPPPPLPPPPTPPPPPQQSLKSSTTLTTTNSSLLQPITHITHNSSGACNKSTATTTTATTTPMRGTTITTTSNAMAVAASNVLLSTPRRPPKMPRFERSTSGNVVQRLNSLSSSDLVALVKDVEIRYRQLSAFEAEEIRRAQRLGFATTTNNPTNSNVDDNDGGSSGHVHHGTGGQHTPSPHHLQTAC